MKLLGVIIISLFLISLTSATTLGTYKSNECVELIQVCSNCTYNNISKLFYPNQTVAVSNAVMTADDTIYNYSFCNTYTQGKYIVNGFGDLDGIKTGWNYDFEITRTGFELNQARSLMFIGLLGLLIFLFIVNIGAISMLPSKDNYDEDGVLISINQMKYIRPVLWVVEWFLLIAIIFIGSNISLAYLGTTLIGNLLFKIYYMMMALSLPMFVLWFIFIFYNIFQDKKMKGYIERGFE